MSINTIPQTDTFNRRSAEPRASFKIGSTFQMTRPLLTGRKPAIIF